MLVHGFDMYRVFISAPGDLERERDACRAAISETNEKEAMPHSILLVSVGLTNDEQIIGYRAAVAGNIRQCTYFVQIFEDDWGPKSLFRKMFFLATECRDDTSMPMREIVACIKNAPHETDPEILAFRKELEETPGVRVLHFSKLDDLTPQLAAVFRDWVGSIQAAAGTAAQ